MSPMHDYTGNSVNDNAHIINNAPWLYLSNGPEWNYWAESDNVSFNDADACIYQRVDHRNEHSCKISNSFLIVSNENSIHLLYMNIRFLPWNLSELELIVMLNSLDIVALSET